MTGLLIGVAISVGALLVVLFATIRNRSKKSKTTCSPDQFQISLLSLTHFSSLRQALDSADVQYLEKRVGTKRAMEFAKERREIIGHFLEALRRDFDNLSELGTAVAQLAPEVSAGQEWRRLQLGIKFRVRYNMIRAELLVAFPASHQVNVLVKMISSMALELEHTMTEIAAGAATKNFGGSSANE
jgi:hypothetical protein